MPIHIYTENFTTKKKESFQIKQSDILRISAQNIDCGYSLEPPRRGGSNAYPQSMLLSRNKKIMYTPVNPIFTIYKWGLRRSKLYKYVFAMTPPSKSGDITTAPLRLLKNKFHGTVLCLIAYRVYFWCASALIINKELSGSIGY